MAMTYALQHLLRITTALVLALIALWGAQAIAQPVLSGTDWEDEEIDDQRQEEDDDEEDDEESAFDSFDEITVQRVSPGDIPDFQPGLPDDAPSRLSTDDLPRSLSGSELQRITDHVASATVELVALSTPPAPYRSTPMIWRGHALWIASGDDGSAPHLVTTTDWLADAEKIYAVVGDISQALSEGGLAVGGHRQESLDNFQADPEELIERHRHNLAPLRRETSNPHVNLTTLRPDGEPLLERADYGLLVHSMESPMPDAIFGYSPALGRSLMPTGYAPIDDLEEAYSFYFPVYFQAILGAPIVGTDGRLLGMTALRYPESADLTLTIPPGAIAAFLDSLDDD